MDEIDINDRKSFELISYILSEVAATATKASKSLSSVFEEVDPWFMMPHPQGHGSLLVSKKAVSALDTLVMRVIKLRDLESRVTYSDIKKELGAEIIKRFVSEGRAIDQKQTDRLLSWAAKRAAARCGEFTYYYPLRFTFTSEPGEIDIGAVKIRWLDQFQPEIFNQVKAYLRANPSESDRKWARKHLRTAAEYYKSYKWVAVVTVKNCDAKRAQDAAHDLLTSALDCLYFLIGRKGTHRVEVGRFQISSDSRALAWIKKDGLMTIQTSTGSLDAMGFPEGWSKDLQREDVVETLQLIRLVLNSKVDLSVRRPIASRFLDAARWFGEGVRDKQSFSKVVKFITAIERLMVAGSKSDIAETVSTRVADLTMSSDCLDDWRLKKKIVKEAYDLRSKLVHGSVSPFSKSVSEGVLICGDVAEEVLYAFLHRVGKDGLLKTDLSEDQYARWFDHIREWVSRLHDHAYRTTG
ncbi:hypothetical protein V5740_08350 [Croceibacterium sp. TMG7-5b_MA50]|uniref:hypothetical protein n=1 Tax=Croceibacterium sp. TMG7-5b_MA50 TaxID=3121290 RepID=UPI0032221660